MSYNVRHQETGVATNGRDYTRPFDDPLDSLTIAAQKIIEAASLLLATAGYDSLTHERIAEAAGVNKSSIRNNFGSKAAVVAAVVDAMIHDGCLELSQRSPASKHRNACAGPSKEFVTWSMWSPSRASLMFSLTPGAIRNFARESVSYRWRYDEIRQWLGMVADAADDPEKARLQLGVARIITAIMDGLLVQLAIEVIPEDVDISPALDALSIMLRAVIDE